MITKTLQNEYWYHVANQDDIPIAGEVEKGIDLDVLRKIVSAMPSEKDKQKEYIDRILEKAPDAIDILRTLIGVSDKRLYLELSYLFSKTRKSPDSEKNILNGDIYSVDKHPVSYFKNFILKANDFKKIAIEIISSYLITRDLIKVLVALKKLEDNELEILVEKWIITKEVQQAEAKRRGHGAEFELAKVLASLDCKIYPRERHLHAIGGRDPNVERDTFVVCDKAKGSTWSFDLIIEKEDNEPIIFIQSLIHTSDPGQYGVNKSDETISIKKDIDKCNAKDGVKRELWGIVDGVGFCENKPDTIDKMLPAFDCFIQMKTIYKAALRLHKLNMVKIIGIKFDERYYNKEQMVQMYERYGSADIKLLTNKNDRVGTREIKAGVAWLYI